MFITTAFIIEKKLVATKVPSSKRQATYIMVHPFDGVLVATLKKCPKMERSQKYVTMLQSHIYSMVLLG